MKKKTILRKDTEENCGKNMQEIERNKDGIE